MLDAELLEQLVQAVAPAALLNVPELHWVQDTAPADALNEPAAVDSSNKLSTVTTVRQPHRTARKSSKQSCRNHSRRCSCCMTPR